MMLLRSELLCRIRIALGRSRVVALLGPRQAGKTTLARQLASESESESSFFDLEDPTDAARLAMPKEVLAEKRGLVILDEIQLMPELLPVLRVLADRVPLPARFLVLGSASPDLVKGSSETLAGRVEFIDVSGFGLAEAGSPQQRDLWIRGGFPLSFLAAGGEDSFAWREAFIRTFLERDLGRYGIGVPPQALRRLWQMLAHHHGGLWNAAEFGRSLGESAQTARRHLDVLTGTYLVRALPPWHENLGKRLVKHPKVYVRDSGILHALLGIDGIDALRGHPKCGASWEGFCVEQILAVCGERHAWFWGTHGGAELDLLVLRGGRRIGFEFKYSETPSTTKSMHSAIADLGLEELNVVHPGANSFPLAEKIWARTLADSLSRCS